VSSEYAPDPWVINFDAHEADKARHPHHYFIRVGGPQGKYAEVSGHMGEANAHIIAAAREMLEALHKLAGNAGALRAFEFEIRAIAGHTNWQCLMDAVADADAAIAKALGK